MDPDLRQQKVEKLGGCSRIRKRSAGDGRFHATPEDGWCASTSSSSHLPHVRQAPSLSHPVSNPVACALAEPQPFAEEPALTSPEWCHGLFWVTHAGLHKDVGPVLCLAVPPSGGQISNLLEVVLGYCQVELDENRRGEDVARQDARFKGILAELPSTLFWTCGRAVGSGSSPEVIGIASNKKSRKQAVQLGVAVAQALQGHAMPTQGEFFRELVEHARHAKACAMPKLPATFHSWFAAPHDSSGARRLAGAPGRPRAAVHGGGEASQGEVAVAHGRLALRLALVGGNLFGKWRVASKPGGREPPPGPKCWCHAAICWCHDSHLTVPLDRWLQAREMRDGRPLSEVLLRRTDGDLSNQGPDAGSWLYYQFVGESTNQAREDWKNAFHGTWFYALWSILYEGYLQESSDLESGHEFWMPGVYCSPNVATARHYARAHNVFGDGLYHRVMLDVRYDGGRLKKERAKGGQQLVLPSPAISIAGVYFQADGTPDKGNERLDVWDPELEILPEEGRLRPLERVDRALQRPPVEQEECTLFFRP